MGVTSVDKLEEEKIQANEDGSASFLGLMQVIRDGKKNLKQTNVGYMLLQTGAKKPKLRGENIGHKLWKFAQEDVSEIDGGTSFVNNSLMEESFQAHGCTEVVAT